MTYRVVLRTVLCGDVEVLLIEGDGGSWHVAELVPAPDDDDSLNAFLQRQCGQRLVVNRLVTWLDGKKARATYDAWKEGGPDA